MDAISYSLAAKQAQRIKKFVAEPDAASGLVTVPSVIASGETVSIPAGRTLVHPNLQVNGTLAVDGTLFIPSGGSVSTTEVDSTVVKQNGSVVANDSAVVHKTGDETIAGVKTFSNNLNFASGARITGDFNNATVANRTLFQTNKANSNTGVYFIPNNVSGSAAVRVTNSSDTVNYNALEINANPSMTSIISNSNGTASALPLTFIINGSEKMRIDTAGNVLVTGSGGLGYGADSGGTVTQLTSKSTAVTLNKPTGRITMNNAALAAGAFVYFIFYNSLITMSDTVVINTQAATYVSLNSYDVKAEAIANGYCYITVKNNTASSLSDALGLEFAIIKGATA